mmetsp:Transcript_28022/g.41120  ORF Transcript_28022/g.41120 Transcript_28022/m.41120 type:complete len:204 (-) Transcript_28022:14-625(-)
MYQGVYFDKKFNKWRARIKIDGKQHHIGTFDTEDQAGIDYARALFKYGVEQRQNAIDLTDVPPQPPILNDSSARKRPLISDDADGIGTEQKGPNQLLYWTTHVGQRQRQAANILGNNADASKERPIVSGGADDSEKKKPRQKKEKFIDLSDVPPKLPILSNRKAVQCTKECTSIRSSTNGGRGSRLTESNTILAPLILKIKLV